MYNTCYSYTHISLHVYIHVSMSCGTRMHTRPRAHTCPDACLRVPQPQGSALRHAAHVHTHHTRAGLRELAHAHACMSPFAWKRRVCGWHACCRRHRCEKIAHVSKRHSWRLQQCKVALVLATDGFAREMPSVVVVEMLSRGRAAPPAAAHGVERCKAMVVKDRLA